ncbi:unnamed protein product [Candidula unifasciata]|uniref:vitamin-K-epoxide reductase (warfarin-sensitive) n=1 Tax=Candidula unifasciata TaxID=100452 RepID=A0A8S3Z1Y5_9EUPU|nr:unnamed protein product [Candidula unifasciata]
MSSTAVVPAYLLWSNATDILFFNVLGVLVCLYALHVEVSKEKDPSYKAMCDISEYMSCSRVLTSQYSQGFGVMHLFFGKNHMLNSRNCNIGLVVFIVHIIICILLPGPIASTIMYCSAFVCVMGSIYLAFILLFVLKDVCLVCFATYVINGCLLYLTHSMYQFYHA